MPRTTASMSTVPEIEVERKKRMQALQEKMASVLSASHELQQVVAEPEKQSSRPRKAPALRIAAAQDSGRRSGRIAGKGAINYDENYLNGVDPTDKVKHVRAKKALFSGKFNEACKEESYSAEHVLALGVATEEWLLFKDGYCSQTGKRIYDKVDGVTCHQCRQKTLGKRTSCSRCQTLFGQLCGDCLFMRYGENVNEANQDEDWVCPCCRDLCNCSAHRSRRGWAPTGTMYRAALAEGYLSVAHCLVLNRLGPDALAAVRAGTLLVPGGYPEKWAHDHGVAFPPPSCAVTSSEAHAAASPGSAEDTLEERAQLDGAAADCAHGSQAPSAASDRTVADGGTGAESGAAGGSPSRSAAKPPLAPAGGVKKRGVRSSAPPRPSAGMCDTGTSTKEVVSRAARGGKITRSMAKGLSGIVVAQPVLGNVTNVFNGPAANSIHGALTRAQRRS